MIRGIDISSYQDNYKLNYQEMLDNNIRFVVVKGGQGESTDRHWEKLIKNKVPVKALYYWNDPINSASYQINYITQDVLNYNPDFIALDVEQWWANWTLYWQYIEGKLNKDSVPVKSDKAISDNAWYILEGLRKNFPGKKIVLYTGEWFVRQYAPSMNVYLNDYPLWLANYVDISLGTRRVTWEEINSLPDITKKSPIYLNAWQRNLANFQAESWYLWQYSSRMIFPGEDYPFDVNLFMGTEEELRGSVQEISDKMKLNILWEEYQKKR